MRVLVTGGAGYIGTHTLLRLLEAEHEVLVYDNFSNSSPEALRRVRTLSNRDFESREGDIRDVGAMNSVIGDFRPEAVVHFAGLKAVGESQEKPLEYYSQNFGGSVTLLDAMQRHGCNRIVFSSSATVYGEAQYLPFDEDHPRAPTNPYGRTKAMVEDIIRDWTTSRPQASAVLLRYFNPVGAHSSGRIGEDPSDIPNNLMPFVAQVAVGRRPEVSIFGNDYETRDGTGERDYIHVEDLAAAHLAALDYSARGTGTEAINVGTGRGTTVLEMIAAFSRAAGRDIPYRIAPPRPGDVARSLAAVTRAERLLGWTAQHGIDEICASTWAWQVANPRGYAD